MNKMLKGFSVGLLIVIAALVPACRSSKKKAVPPTTTTEATSTVPPVPVTETETKVDTQPTDFVQETPKPSVEPLPANIEALNQTVQSRGLIKDAFFAYDESTLTADAQSALTTSANWLKQNPTYGILIEGHCDERGTEQYNLALADRRASIARDYLVTLGVESGRIKTISYGEERPFAEGHSETAWAQNRRAHLVIVSPPR
ncbi:MAG TPA: peptidoglycan-associated lipoprotein Pal [Thermoanaerobaculia bacterium]|nr:peptidoglycan-associated lipoprotein Pal [Thermoanaerobaculia bacterium]